MNRGLQGLMVLVLVAGFFVAAGTSASADHVVEEDTSRYRDAMWHFVPELGRWTGELQYTLNAIELKPEVAYDLAALAHRGEYMIYDLENTQPPAALAETHENLLFAVRQMTEAAQIGDFDLNGAQLLMDNEMVRFSTARRQIRRWLLTDIEVIGSGLIAVEPVTVK